MTQAQIAPLDQSSLRDSAYQALRDAFIRGAFAPGDVLSLRALAEQLGTSMTPVREAVRRLVAEGALIDTQSRTLLVPDFSARRMADLKSARLALETMVLDQAMDRIDAAGIAELRDVLQPSSDRTDSRPDLVRNYRFHFQLYRHSGSEVLMPIVEALWVQYGSYLNLIIHKQAAREIEQDLHHLEIIAALEAGERDAAKSALKADIERSFNVLNLAAAGGSDRTTER
ncbi:MAG: GntR family transcriptional regulator [Pseudomonadota bacterium]